MRHTLSLHYLLVLSAICMIGGTVLAEEMQSKKLDWCEIRVPKTVPLGGIVNIEVKYAIGKKPMKLYCDLHYNNKAGHWKRKIAIGGVFDGLKDTGTCTFSIPVPANKEDVGTVFGVLFLTPKGWNEKIKQTNSPKVSVTAYKKPTFPELKIKPNYASKHPRVLFGPEDRTELKARMAKDADIWKHVLWQANAITRGVPSAAAIKKGTHYWKSEWFLSGALAYHLTGETRYKDAVVAWMKAHAAVDIWGVGWQENIDIVCNWYMYYMSLAYDILYHDMSKTDRDQIRAGIVAHAGPVFKYWSGNCINASFDQNHTYVPVIALATAGFAFLDEEPDAQGWINLANFIAEKSRKVLTTDGYYYEGTSYWEYAFHWHFRWADMVERATGRDMYDLPIFKKNHLQPLHTSFPGHPYSVDVGDSGFGANSRGSHKPKPERFGRKAMVARIASRLKSAEAQGVYDFLWERGKETVDDPATLFLWHNPDLEGSPITKQAPYHHFNDMGIVFWRSSWGKDATVCMFKAGPPLGYSAVQALKDIPGWQPNTGHVHPDMGAIWLYAKGAYLITDTGYTTRKRTSDNNTFLVDGKGIGMDNTYWVYRGSGRERGCYPKWAKAKLDKVHLEKNYGYAMGNISDVYPDDLGPLKIHRHTVMSRDFVLLVDELGGREPHTFTSLLHTDNQIVEHSNQCYTSEIGGSSLAIYVIAPQAAKITPDKAIVFGGGRSPHVGKEHQRGYQLSIETPAPVRKARYVTLLVPRKSGENLPTSVKLLSSTASKVTVAINWGGRTQKISLDLKWQKNSSEGPVKPM